MALNQTSIKRLEGVHPLLISVVKRAAELSKLEFQITEGVRTLERQKQLVAEHKSKTMQSYHLVGKAVDVVVLINGTVNWDLKNYKIVNDAFQQAAQELNAKVTWGGMWKSIVDGPHFQLEI